MVVEACPAVDVKAPGAGVEEVVGGAVAGLTPPKRFPPPNGPPVGAVVAYGVAVPNIPPVAAGAAVPVGAGVLPNRPPGLEAAAP